MKSIHIFPSLIAADLLNLEQTVKNLDPYCDGFHIDIMDNHFVPNLTWGPMFAQALDTVTTHPSWIHLMVEKPEAMIPQLMVKPKSIISFHIEATKHIEKTLNTIKKNSWITSIAIKPSTPLEDLYPYLPSIEHVLLMSVKPGFSGQTFIPESIERLKKLVAYKTHHKLTFDIGMDGGITDKNIHNCTLHGAVNFAIASGIFSHHDTISALRKLYNQA